MDIDLSWLDDFKEEEINFFKFYLKKVNFVNLVYIYIKNDEIVFLKTERLNKLVNNTIKDNEIITFIKKNQILNSTKFTFKHFCSYNFSLRPNEVKEYLLNDNIQEDIINNRNYKNFFKSYGCIQDIEFNDTIEMFQELNTLYFIYGEKKEKEKRLSTTKKVYITHSNKKTRKNR